MSGRLWTRHPTASILTGSSEARTAGRRTGAVRPADPGEKAALVPRTRAAKARLVREARQGVQVLLRRPEDCARPRDGAVVKAQWRPCALAGPHAGGQLEMDSLHLYVGEGEETLCCFCDDPKERVDMAALRESVQCCRGCHPSCSALETDTPTSEAAATRDRASARRSGVEDPVIAERQSRGLVASEPGEVVLAHREPVPVIRHQRQPGATQVGAYVRALRPERILRSPRLPPFGRAQVHALREAFLKPLAPPTIAAHQECIAGAQPSPKLIAQSRWAGLGPRVPRLSGRSGHLSPRHLVAGVRCRSPSPNARHLQCHAMKNVMAVLETVADSDLFRPERKTRHVLIHDAHSCSGCCRATAPSRSRRAGLPRGAGGES